MDGEPVAIALYYDDSAYRETLEPAAHRQAGKPAGLMGRQVAGKEFLDAYLSHGDWAELFALVPNAASEKSIAEFCRSHPSSRHRERRLRVIQRTRFFETFLPDPPAPRLYFPCPPDPAFAWARESGPPHGFSLSGVTHTLCSARAVEVLRGMLTAPYEPYDRLISTSRAVAEMVQGVWDAYAEHLRERHGGQPRPRIRLETIPLGVNVEKFRPATKEERTLERQRLGIADDEIAVLFVGRLSHHAKAHPFPMYRSLSEAAAQTRQKVHLLMVGWAASAAVRKAFEDGAKSFGPNVQTSFLDGLQSENRFGAWRAADVFMSLSDNLQETFGLVIIEAMAGGLPVVASDWNGYRDLVASGETGFLVPTAGVRDSLSDLTSRLVLDVLNYDHFLARASQAVAVDVAATTKALVQLFQDRELRRRMGAAGRRRAEEQFSWQGVIRAYEELWREQERERQDYLRLQTQSPRRYAGPAAYPAPEYTFAGYPTCWLDANDQVTAAPGAADRLEELLQTPLTNHVAECRSADLALLSSLLSQAEETCLIADLETVLESAGVPRQTARATLAWFLKYDLLRAVFPNSGRSGFVTRAAHRVSGGLFAYFSSLDFCETFSPVGWPSSSSLRSF